MKSFAGLKPLQSFSEYIDYLGVLSKSQVKRESYQTEMELILIQQNFIELIPNWYKEVLIILSLRKQPVLRYSPWTIDKTDAASF